MTALTTSSMNVYNLIHDGLEFIATVLFTLVGILSLIQLVSSAFTFIIFSVLMIPVLFSTTTYLTRDISKASGILIA